MKTKASSTLTSSSCRAALSRFLKDHVTVEIKRGEFLITLPLLYPNGMQVGLSLKELSSTTALLSDKGEVIAALDDHNIDLRKKTSHRDILDERIKAFELHRSGMAIQKMIPLPLDGLDVHLFGEALVSMSHLIYRHEAEAPRAEHVYFSIRKLLVTNDVQFKEKEDARIAGKVEQSIRVDFLIPGKRGLACKTIERRGRMREYMEQWGYRWRDLKDQHPHLKKTMFYDPENQNWDTETLRIGKSVCDIFEPYFEVEKIEGLLAKYKN
jgi:hypothetical protein